MGLTFKKITKMKQLKVFLALILVISCSKKQAHRLKEEGKIKGAGGTPHPKQELVDTLTLVNTLSQGDGALDTIEKFIENKSLNINGFYKIKGKEMTPLQIAAAYEQPETVKLLLEQRGILIDKATQSSNRTALHLAAEKGSQKAATILIRERANADRKTADGKTALHFAAKKGCEPIVKALLSNNVTHDDGSSAGYPGRSTDSPGRKSEKYLGLPDDDGNTPLHLAAKEGRTQVVRILLEKGANPEIRNRAQKTAKDLAKGSETQEVIANYILEQQVGSTYRTLKSRLTKEYIGDELEHIKVYLEENKFRANSIINDQNHTFLYYVVEKGFEKTVRILVETEEEGKLIDAIHANNDYKHAPLYLAVQNGNFELVRLLIYGRAMKDNRMKENAEEEVEYGAVKAMLGVVRNLQDQDQRTLLHWAALTDALEILQLLTEFMAIAAEKKEKEKRFLLYEDVMEDVDYVNEEDKAGNTALRLAASKRIAEHLQKIKKLSKEEWEQKVASKCGQVSTTIGGNIEFSPPGFTISGSGSRATTPGNAGWEEAKIIVLAECRGAWLNKEKRKRIWRP